MRRNFIRVIYIAFIFTLIRPLIAIPSEQIFCTGKVTDTEGKPIAGAKVTAYEMQFDGIAGNFILRKAGEKTTADDGTFTIEAEPKPQKSTFYDCKMVVVKPEFALGWAVWGMHENAEVEIEIGKPERLEGIIVDEAGKPVAGAQVRANLSRKVKTADGEETSQWLPGISPLDELGTETDVQGKFSFHNIPADVNVDLLVMAPGKAITYTYQSDVSESAFKSGQTDVKVVVPDEAQIAGKIIDLNTGNGISRTKFAIVATFSGSFYYRFVGTTNDNGTFDIGGLQAGQYLIRGDFPSINVDVISGKSTNDVLIGVNRQEGELSTEQIKTENDRELQILFGIRILDVPPDVDDDVLGHDNRITNGIVVRSGYEFAGTLLELVKQNKDAKLLSSPQLLTFIGEQASISMAAKEYVSGYKLAEDGSGELKPKMKSFNTCDYKIKGVLKDDNRIHLTLSGSLRQPVFETRRYIEGYDYQVPLPGRYFSVEGTTKNNEPLTVGLLRPDKPALYLIITPSCLFPEPEPESLLGKILPEFDNISNIKIPDNFEGKPILVCLFDIEQRPSRNCAVQLTKQTRQLEEKNVAVIIIQASKIDGNALNEWLKDQNIPFSVGMIEAKEKETRLAWGVKSLPWLILTDTEHVVTAEGFSISELDEKIE